MPSSTGISALPLHDALPISWQTDALADPIHIAGDIVTELYASTTGTDADWRSEEHTSELQSLRHLVCRLPPVSPLFPYTTLFRSPGRPTRSPTRSTSPATSSPNSTPPLPAPTPI